MQRDSCKSCIYLFIFTLTMRRSYSSSEEDEDGPSTSYKPAPKKSKTAKPTEQRAAPFDLDFPRLPSYEELIRLAFDADEKIFKVYGVEVGLAPHDEETVVRCWAFNLQEDACWLHNNAGDDGFCSLSYLWQRAQVHHAQRRGLVAQFRPLSRREQISTSAWSR